MTVLGEKIIGVLSREPAAADYCEEKEKTLNVENSLFLLKKEYPNFSQIVCGKKIIDFGCGDGYQAVALALKEKCFVHAVDTNPKALEKAMLLAKEKKLSDKSIVFTNKISETQKKTFDVVISQNSFEHFSDPDSILDEMKSLINDGGKLLISFGPPWLTAYGSHMNFFCKFPWVNIIFSEKTVMNVRGRYVKDGAKKYEEVKSGLNKMTISKFEKIIANSGLKIKYKKYACSKNLNFLSTIPFIKEFFTNRVTVILEF